MQLTTGFVELPDEFVAVFNAPTFLLFVDLMTGWTLSHRHRFVTDLILSAGAVGKGHFFNYHRYVQFLDRPWYPRKEEPSFADMLTTLRRRSWENKLRDLWPKRGPLKKHVTEIIHFLSLAG